MCGGGGEYVSSAGGGGLGWGLASGPETGAESSSGPALSIAALSSKQRPTPAFRGHQDTAGQPLHSAQAVGSVLQL